MKREGVIHAADPDKSVRLRRVLGVLADGREHSTLDLMTQARVCAVSACISELRESGHRIDCRMAMTDGQRRWFYRLAPRTAPTVQIKTNAFALNKHPTRRRRCIRCAVRCVLPDRGGGVGVVNTFSVDQTRRPNTRLGWASRDVWVSDPTSADVVGALEPASTVRQSSAYPYTQSSGPVCQRGSLVLGANKHIKPAHRVAAGALPSFGTSDGFYPPKGKRKP